MNELIEKWAPKIGVDRACWAFGVHPRTWRHRRQKEAGTLPERPSRAKPEAEKRPHPAKIDDATRTEIRSTLCERRFCDLAPAQVYATLLDEGVYLASVSTMYRVLRAENLTGERRRGHRRKGHAPPQVSADAPRQVWSWDISRLRGPGPRDWFYLYVILDIFSRKIVGWCIDTEETETVAKRLITITCERENIEADQLTLHSDRGAQMTSTTIAELLEDLSVTRSLSRPRVSDDNPYSEAAFKTVKYRPSYPDWFDSIEDARVWMRKFVGWYNTEHYHSGIGYLHPNDLHNGTANKTIDARQQVLDAAYQAHPERFLGGPPTADRPPAAAWINKPTIQTKS